MPSPFPGMNPYLEQDDVWHDFHQRMVPAIAEALAPQVRPRYIVKLEQQAYIHEQSADERRLLGRPDVAVLKPEGAGPGAGGAAAVSRVAAPAYARVPVAVDVEKLSHVEIRNREGRDLVTVIELLSPSNKEGGPDREQYLAKRREFLSSGAHFIELDLLRGGPRLPLEDLPDCDYYALVSRREERPRVGIWPIQLRQPLPEIPVPLRSGDGDARLNLQQILHRVYDAAVYEDYIYRGTPRPRLHPADAEWAGQILGRQSS